MRELRREASLQHGYIRTEQARACGVTQRQLHYAVRAGDLIHIAHGLYRLADAVATPDDQLHELAVSIRSSVFSHETALEIWGVSDILARRIHLTVPTASGAKERPIVVIHRSDLGPRDRTARRGLPVTSLARTLRDCASSGVDPEQLTRAFSEGVERGMLSPADATALRTRYPYSLLGQEAEPAQELAPMRVRRGPPDILPAAVRREMSAEQMRAHLTEVGALLADQGRMGELVIAGGAVMVMMLGARDGSHDIDALFAREAGAIRAAVAVVAERHALPAAWLNDHVREFIDDDAPIVDAFELPGLRVRMVRLDYLFYMKAMAGDPVDAEDMRAIAGELGLQDEREADAIVSRFAHGTLPESVEILLESLFQ